MGRFTDLETPKKNSLFTRDSLCNPQRCLVLILRVPGTYPVLHSLH